MELRAARQPVHTESCESEGQGRGSGRSDGCEHACAGQLHLSPGSQPPRSPPQPPARLPIYCLQLTLRQGSSSEARPRKSIRILALVSEAMTSLAGQPLLVPILPPAPHEPVAQAVVLRLSESSLDALRELVRSGLLEKPGGSPTVELELNDAGPSVRYPLLRGRGSAAPFLLGRSACLPYLQPRTAEVLRALSLLSLD